MQTTVYAFSNFASHWKIREIIVITKHLMTMVKLWNFPLVKFCSSSSYNVLLPKFEKKWENLPHFWLCLDFELFEDLDKFDEGNEIDVSNEIKEDIGRESDGKHKSEGTYIAQNLQKVRNFSNSSPLCINFCLQTTPIFAFKLELFSICGKVRLKIN